jgi:hypothetical protein
MVVEKEAPLSLLIILLQVWSVTRKYAFNPSKIRFHPNTKLPTNATGKSHHTGWRNKNETALSLISPKHQNPPRPRADWWASRRRPRRGDGFRSPVL